MMNVREINEIEGLEPYRSAWHALLRRTKDASFFQTLEWLEVYWKHYGSGKRLRVLLVIEKDDLQGIIPMLVLQEKTRVGIIRFLTYPLSSWGSFYAPKDRWATHRAHPLPSRLVDYDTEPVITYANG